MSHIINLLAVLIPIIIIHELGHFVMARWCKVHVLTFSIGFGKQLVSWQDRHGTLWRLALFPLGGYVRMAQETEPQSMRFESRGVMAQSRSGKYWRSYPSCAYWQRALIIFAGPLANFLSAAVIFAAIALAQGVPDPDFQPPVVIGAVEPDSPAQRAGLLAEDQIISADQQELSSPTQLAQIIQAAAGRAVALEVLRQDTVLILSPQAQLVDDRWLIGIRFAAIAPPRVKTNIVSAVTYGTVEMVSWIGLILSELWKLISGATSIDNLGGVVMVATYSTEAVNLGWILALRFIAIISINIGIVNLLPIPILDGGQLLLLGVESIRKRPIPPQVHEALLRGGLIVILGLFVLATVNDIIRLL